VIPRTNKVLEAVELQREWADCHLRPVVIREHRTGKSDEVHGARNELGVVPHRVVLDHVLWVEEAVAVRHAPLVVFNNHFEHAHVEWDRKILRLQQWIVK